MCVTLKKPKIPIVTVLDDLIDFASFAKVCKGSLHRNDILVLVTQNLFHQVTSSRDIFLSTKQIVVFKNPRNKTQIVFLARHIYPEKLSIFHKTYLDACRDSHTYLFLDLTQRSIKIRKKVVSPRNNCGVCTCTRQ